MAFIVIYDANVLYPNTDLFVLVGTNRRDKVGCVNGLLPGLC